MDLSLAIKKCTSLPASRVGLKNRGILLPGYQADIVIFNPETIIDTATYPNPHQFAAGINDVLVNGIHTIGDGKALGALGGVLLNR